MCKKTRSERFIEKFHLANQKFDYFAKQNRTNYRYINRKVAIITEFVEI